MAKQKNHKTIDKSTVRRYGHFEELKDCLASGWPPATVHSYLVERYGPEGVPHEMAIRRWREKYLSDNVMVLPHRVISQKLHGVAYKVDVIGHLSRLIAICEDRLGRGLEQEMQFGMPLAVNDGVVQIYLQAIRDYVKVAQDLGILKSPVPSPFLIDARTQQLIVAPETLKALRETVAEIKRLEASYAGPGRTEGSYTSHDEKAGDLYGAEGRAE